MPERRKLAFLIFGLPRLVIGAVVLAAVLLVMVLWWVNARGRQAGRACSSRRRLSASAWWPWPGWWI